MNHRHQLSTTAAADGLQQGSGLRRIVCLAALLFIFVAGVRAQYPITETAFPDKNFYKVVLEKYSMSATRVLNMYTKYIITTVVC